MIEDIRTLFAAYLDDEVTPAERHTIETALEANPELRAELDTLKHIRERAKATLSAQAEQNAPADAFTKLQARLHTAERPAAHLNGGHSTMLRQTRDQRPILTWGFAAVAVLTAVVAAVLLVGRATRSEQVAADNPAADQPAASEVTPVVEDSPPVEESLLVWNYIPESFYIQNATGFITADGFSAMEYRYNNNDQFVIVTETTSRDEPLPEGDVLIVQGNPGVLQTGLTGTADITADMPRSGQPEGEVVGGGGGGGGGNAPDNATYPDQIPYENGLRIVWDDGTRRVDVLTNLSTEEAMRVVEGLSWDGTPLTVVEAPDNDLPQAPIDAQREITTTFRLTPPDNFYAATTVDVWDEAEGHIHETRYSANEEFIIVQRRLADNGESTAEGSFLLRDQPARLAEGLSGEAILMEPVLQDGVQRPLLNGVQGGGGGGSAERDAPTFPQTIAYTDGMQISWVEEGLYWTAISNLPQVELVEALESITIAQPQGASIEDADGNTVTFSTFKFVPMLPVDLLNPFPLVGTNEMPPEALFYVLQNETDVVLVSQFAVEGQVPGESSDEFVEVNGTRVAIYRDMSNEATMADGQTYTVENGISLNWLTDAGTSSMNITTTLPLEEALNLIASMEEATSQQ